ncbi:hypothetical protein PFISCL1PPCAC_16448, partial [Pristionchus fissidentatus]
QSMADDLPQENGPNSMLYKFSKQFLNLRSKFATSTETLSKAGSLDKLMEVIKTIFNFIFSFFAAKSLGPLARLSGALESSDSFVNVTLNVQLGRQVENPHSFEGAGARVMEIEEVEEQIVNLQKHLEDLRQMMQTAKEE